MQCSRCQGEVPLAAGERVGVRDECPHCQGDLHACVNCAHRDPAAYNGCREPSAERVLDPERANRCDYFRPSEVPAGAGTGGGERDAAMAALDALFKKD